MTTFGVPPKSVLNVTLSRAIFGGGEDISFVVTVFGEWGNPQPFSAVSIDGPKFISGITNNSGQFAATLGTMPEGRYTVLASWDGYYDGSPDLIGSTTFVVSRSAVTLDAVNAPTYDDGQTGKVIASLRNPTGISTNAHLDWLVEGNIVSAAEIIVPPGEVVRAILPMTLSPGDHQVGARLDGDQTRSTMVHVRRAARFEASDTQVALVGGGQTKILVRHAEDIVSVYATLRFDPAVLRVEHIDATGNWSAHYGDAGTIHLVAHFTSNSGDFALGTIDLGLRDPLAGPTPLRLEIHRVGHSDGSPGSSMSRDGLASPEAIALGRFLP